MPAQASALWQAMRLPLLAVAISAAWPALAAASSEGSGKTFAPVENWDRSQENPGPGFAVIPGRDPNGWSFTLEPYVWAMGASGTVGVKGLPTTQIDYGASTILQHLDWGLMAEGEVRKGRWGLMADGLFAQLSASGDPPDPFYSSTSIKLQQGMASLALAFRVIDDRRGFVDIYAGARYNYMGFNIGASTDSDRIDSFSDAAAQRIVEGATSQVQDYLAANADAIADRVADAAREALTTKALEKIAAFPGGIDRREAIRIINQIRQNSSAYREMIAAVAQARIAAAKNQLTNAIQNRVEAAQKKLAKALSRSIEDTLPKAADGTQWWVDPIIGLRAQINLTRWLFLAAQGDVGGFGAGSNIAWNVQATLGVNFTRTFFGEIGYRYFYMDYGNGGAVYDAAEYGLFLGLGVKL